MSAAINEPAGRLFQLEETNMVDKQLLEIMACPACLSPVVEQGDRIICQGKQCGLRFPIRDGLPRMLISEAEGDAELLAKLRADPAAFVLKRESRTPPA
jgi:uncharacterized protein YbaR (Trm112 family)